MATLTQKQKDNATSKRLFQKYGITLEEYSAMLSEQGGVCKICQKAPTGRKLHTDHCHSLVQTKIDSKKISKGNWEAFIIDLGLHGFGRTKSEALKKVKHKLKKLSIRGLTCWHCNTGLKWFMNDPEVMESAALYLRNHQTALTSQN